MTINLKELIQEPDPSNYVLAGAITLVGLINRFLDKTKDDFFDEKSLNNFFSLKCDKFLHSYGLNISTRSKLGTKFNKRISKVLELFKQNDIFSRTKIFLDSGGFQVSSGSVTKEQLPKLIQSYNEFLVDYSHLFNYAFILDLVPGPNCLAFNTYEDVYESNLDSYLLSSQLPDDIRKKVIYIHHFRTPKQLSVFRKILFENDLFKQFDYFGTGGLVANLASDSNVNVILYIIPLIDLLYRTKLDKRKVLNFHILGGAGFRDIFFYELMKIHVKKVHNIKLNITFDSSSIFKGLMIARYIHVLENEQVLNMTLKEDRLSSKWKDGIEIKDQLQRTLHKFYARNGFKIIDFSNPYDPNSGTLRRECSIYLMLYVLDFFFEMQNFLKQKAKSIYEYFEQDQLSKFNQKVEEVLRNLNQGKLTRKQQSKSYSIWRSLAALTDLDLDYSQHLVNKFLAKDEYSNLVGAQELLTF